jgi:hypothetical protein
MLSRQQVKELVLLLKLRAAAMQQKLGLKADGTATSGDVG